MDAKIDTVYTRSGDAGQTRLADGVQVSKASLQIEAIGELDHLVSVIGFARDLLDEKTIQLKPILILIQQELFNLGTEISANGRPAPDGFSFCNAQSVERLEQLCDTYNSELAQLDSFVLPGGAKVSSILHVCRTSCRNAERRIVALSENAPGTISSYSLGYINRLGDLFFILARWALKHEGGQEILLGREGE